METQTTTTINMARLIPDAIMATGIITSARNAADDFRMGKKSFLVFKDNKYLSVLTQNIAFFYIKYESTMIMCFDRQEYFVNYSLEQIQGLLPGNQFYRLNRQYLINFDAIKEVEHYFSRRLLVNSSIATKNKLIVSKDKVSEFLHWLDNR